MKYSRNEMSLSLQKQSYLKEAESFNNVNVNNIKSLNVRENPHARIWKRFAETLLSEREGSLNARCCCVSLCVCTKV